MKVCNGIDTFSPPPGGITLTIGNFDGVHRGHRDIIRTARKAAAESHTPLVAMTFEPHPMAAVAPDRAPARLVTLGEKLSLLSLCGVEACMVVRSEPALLEQSAETFLSNLSRRCRPQVIVEGLDFNFGRGREGSVQTLHDFAPRLGFSVRVVETTRCDELPGAPAVRSSAIRTALSEGRIGAAAAMLGRPHRIVGTVIRGAGRGLSLGFPTANLDGIPHLLPQQAVYAAAAQFEDGTLHLAVVNVGPQPTFGQSTPQVEAHVPNWSGALVGQRLGLHFLAMLREQARFANAAELATQLGRDVAAARAYAGDVQELERRPRIPLGAHNR